MTTLGSVGASQSFIVNCDSAPANSSADNLISVRDGNSSTQEPGPSRSNTAKTANMDTKHRSSTDAKPHAVETAAVEAVDQEHALGFREAIKLYPTAVGWSLFVSIGVIMLAFDPQIVGSMYAMPQFQKDFGYQSENGEVRLLYVLLGSSDAHIETD